MPVDVQIMWIVMGALAFTGTVASTVWALVHFKLKKKELEARGSDPELGLEVDALRDDLNDTRAQLADMQEHTGAQLADMQERLDFAERLLTAGRASQENRSE